MQEFALDYGLEQELRDEKEPLAQAAEEAKEEAKKEKKEETKEAAESEAAMAAALQEELVRVKAEFAAKLRELEVNHGVELLLQEAGARNVQAAKALLDISGLLGAQELPAGWRKSLQRQVAALQEAPETAFLFARMPGGMQGWVGLRPVAGDEEDLGDEGGFRLRLAQAGGVQESIRIKQEAAASGIFI